MRKDFTVDAYQIYQAKVLGAEAVLLICALLDTEEIREDLAICRSLGINAIVEAHDAAEVSSAVNAGADIIGVNNRNLKDFTVDIHNGLRLRSLVPEDVLFIAESGIKTRRTSASWRKAMWMRCSSGRRSCASPDKKKALAVLRGKRGNPMTRIKICGLKTARGCGGGERRAAGLHRFVFAGEKAADQPGRPPGS